jgi:hypothetical protein
LVKKAQYIVVNLEFASSIYRQLLAPIVHGIIPANITLLSTKYVLPLTIQGILFWSVASVTYVCCLFKSCMDCTILASPGVNRVDVAAEVGLKV